MRHLKRNRAAIGLLISLIACMSVRVAGAADLRPLAQGLVAKLEQAGLGSGTVMDFTDLQGSPTELGRFLAQQLSDVMVSESRKFAIVDRANLQYLLREKRLSAEGLINPETSRKLGKLIGVDTIILGTTTPLGETIHVSVRGIAVETGRVVASQSASLTASPGLQVLYNRGVSGPPSGGSVGGPIPTPHGKKLRDVLRPGSIKFTANEVVIGRQLNTVSFNVENLTGVGLGIGIRDRGGSAGACNYQHSDSGLVRVYNSDLRSLTSSEDPSKMLHWLPPGAKASATLNLACDRQLLSGVRSVPVTAVFVISAGKEVIEMPLTAEGTKVRNGYER